MAHNFENYEKYGLTFVDENHKLKTRVSVLPELFFESMRTRIELDRIIAASMIATILAVEETTENSELTPFGALILDHIGQHIISNSPVLAYDGPMGVFES